MTCHFLCFFGHDFQFFTFQYIFLFYIVFSTCITFKSVMNTTIQIPTVMGMVAHKKIKTSALIDLSFILLFTFPTLFFFFNSSLIFRCYRNVFAIFVWSETVQVYIFFIDCNLLCFFVHDIEFLKFHFMCLCHCTCHLNTLPIKDCQSNVYNHRYEYPLGL